ncbi:DUF928 domain-containing protein [Nostoc sp. CHAB 5836]|uniref:DUF928 domain-containing protein n=1 Tax=Nostoc sp. CHAB 5836 TaxID=2780404 RepID=UPI001E4BD0F6|nr:DUF928 domain-containing protein [Nostoc sp. CHAB 5836]MCC5619279.1 DUF928 domain-containing protein [Nostoc sp. CHAB 5836]
MATITGYRLISTFTIIYAFINFTAYLPIVNAQTSNNNQTVTPKRQRVTFKPPNRGAPKKRIAAASRGGCPDTKQPLTALVPNKDINLTYSEYPKFWFYIPDLPTQARVGEFIVQDKQKNDLYRTSITLPDKAGIISVSLPDNSQNYLALNQSYRWYFKIYCQPQDTSVYFFVDGNIKRVSPSNYSLENIWFDNLTYLAQKLRATPQNPTARDEWAAFLKDGELTELSNEPLLDCCSLSK